MNDLTMKSKFMAAIPSLRKWECHKQQLLIFSLNNNDSVRAFVGLKCNKKNNQMRGNH